MTRDGALALLGLAIIPLLTFAISASDPKNKCRVTADYGTICDGSDGDAAFTALFAAVGWPLYWTWAVADYVRDNQHDT